MQPKHIVEIPVESLRKGLYVSQLDRPWLGSPFLFQGFEIQTDDEIEQLKQVCRTVYVQLAPHEVDALLTGSGSVRAGGAAQSLLVGNPNRWIARGPATDPVSMRTELQAATTIYGEARASIGRVLDRLRQGADLDLQTVAGVVDSMTESIFRNRDALSWLARLKNTDDYLYDHSLAVSVWALAFGRHLGFDRETIRALGVGAMLLDVGKTQLPLHLLRKPGSPDAEEWVALRSHVDRGLEILGRDPTVTPLVKQMIHAHHERMDGSGYPLGLKGEEIPMVGRILGIVDTYDAMISSRPYAEHRSTFDAIRELKRLGKSWFQPQLVELFTQAVGVFPAGSLVELNTGEVAVVVIPNRFRRLRPQVMLVLDANKTRRAQFTLIDLQVHTHGNVDQRPELWIEHGLAPGSYGIDPSEFFL